MKELRITLFALAVLGIATGLGCHAQMALNQLVPDAQAQTEVVRTKLTSVLRPAPSGQGGPWFVMSEKDGAVFKVTTGLTTPNAALNQARDDQASQLGGGINPVRIVVSTDASNAP